MKIIADVSRAHRAAGFHQNHSTSFGKARLAAAAFAVDQLHQFFVENAIAKEVGEAGDGLLDRANALHDFCALPQQGMQFFLRRPNNFLHMADVVPLVRSRPTATALPVFHIRSYKCWTFVAVRSLPRSIDFANNKDGERPIAASVASSESPTGQTLRRGAEPRLQVSTMRIPSRFPSSSENVFRGDTFFTIAGISDAGRPLSQHLPG